MDKKLHLMLTNYRLDTISLWAKKEFEGLLDKPRAPHTYPNKRSNDSVFTNRHESPNFS